MSGKQTLQHSMYYGKCIERDVPVDLQNVVASEVKRYM